MSEHFDVVVVGTGFGGAAVACRLAQRGARVLALERGRRWTLAEYPRQAGDSWLYHPAKPEKLNGWLDLRFFRGMIVAQGAGVGGGSQCYSSVLMPADDHLFDDGWPPEITAPELAPHYANVAKMLSVVQIPEGQMTGRARLLARAAERLGETDRFGRVPLGVAFDPEWNYELDDPLDVGHSRPFVNDHGQQQGTCVHLGNCDIGCDVRAKNTLDLNYIPAAERHGAQVRPLHVVRCVEPEEAGYKVRYDRIADGKLVPGDVSADRVVLAAGSLGSTELLLRCRDQYGTLPAVSPALGRRWSANANVFTTAVYDADAGVQQSIGPTITTGMDYMDGSVGGQRFYIEDDGFPNVLLGALTSRLRSGRVDPLGWALQTHLRRGLDEKNPARNMMVWLGEGVDAGDGQLRIGRAPFAPWRRELRLTWDVSRSRRVIDEIIATQKRLSESTGGRFRVPLSWRLLRQLATVHPLGGCTTGTSAADAVVDHRGEVFGYPGLFVADGSVLPGALGRNPSMTIAALGERTAALMSA